MPAQPLDRGLPAECVGVHLEERLVVLDHHRLPDRAREQVHVEQQRLRDPLRVHLDADAERGDGGHVLLLGQRRRLLRRRRNVHALVLVLPLLAVLHEALDLRVAAALPAAALVVVVVVQPLENRRARIRRHLAGGGRGLLGGLLLGGEAVGLLLAQLRRGRGLRRLALPPHALLFLPLLLLQPHGLHHARVLAARDRPPADALQRHHRQVLAPLLPLLLQLQPRQEATCRVLEDDGAAAEELGALALHLVDDLALEEDHRLAESHLLLRDLHRLHHRLARRPRVAADRDVRADAGEGADELGVKEARGEGLARHAHGLDHTAAPQLLDSLLVVEQFGLFLRVGVHAAHEMGVGRVDGVHERLEVLLERRRDRRVVDLASAAAADATRLGVRRDLRGLVLEELGEELGLRALDHHHHVVREDVLVLLAELGARIRHGPGVVVDDEGVVALLRCAEMRRPLDLRGLRELVEELLVVTLGHDAYVVEARLDAEALGLDQLYALGVVDEVGLDQRDALAGV
mmetsp:Transcript_57526/g.135064  ORF Transcript_57526/g.135064 Transcript_57526/m.135064 type:complete len:518 (-) Transcript_57526:1582-3135(-)